MIEFEQQSLFDYSSLDTDTRTFVQEKAQAIHARLKRTAEDIIAIGADLIAVNEKLAPHGKFHGWLRSEFDMTRQSAYRFMGVARKFGGCNIMLQHSPTVLYSLLDTPGTIIEMVETKQIPSTVSSIQEAKREYQQEHQPPQPVATTDIFKADYADDEDEADTEPELPAYTPPRYNAPIWTPTIPSPVPTPAPMPASLYSTYTEEDEEEGREETIEGCDCHTVDTGETTEYYHHNGLTPDAIQYDKEEHNHFMPLMSSSETPEWYTPLSIIERVRTFFGEIDLDPCSNSHETPNVPARTLYTKDDDGLTQSWHGSTYMNPPYGGEISKWVKKLLDEYECGNVKEAIALVPGRIDTAWFQPLYEHLICAIKGRVQFIGASTNSAPFPSVAVYLGPRKEDFIQTFKDMGPIVTRIA